MSSEAVESAQEAAADLSEALQEIEIEEEAHRRRGGGILKLIGLIVVVGAIGAAVAGIVRSRSTDDWTTA
jgi:hypothetical protein